MLDRQSLDQISKYIQFSRDYPDRFEKSQTKVFNQYLKRLEKLEELDYFEMKSNQWMKRQENLIQQSRIICTTLSSSGQSKFQKLKDQVDVLVIDEACQSNELESLIPFQLDPKKVIMVGDPKQLPQTVVVPNAEYTLYNRSLYERLKDCGVREIMLNI